MAKPDGLLVVPADGELAFLHPLPVERLWGVGPVTAAKLHERRITTVGQVARLGEAALVSMLGRRRRPAPARAGPQPRPAPGPGRPAARVDRVAAGAGPVAAHARPTLDAALVGLVDRVTRRMRAADRVGRTVVLRLRFDDFTRATRSHTLARATAHTETILDRGRGPAGGGAADDRQRGITLVGVAVGNLRRRRREQLELPFDAHSGDDLDTALDAVRDRFGSASVTRAVLLGRDQGLTVPLLPD